MASSVELICIDTAFWEEFSSERDFFAVTLLSGALLPIIMEVTVGSLMIDGIVIFFMPGLSVSLDYEEVIRRRLTDSNFYVIPLLILAVFCSISVLSLFSSFWNS